MFRERIEKIILDKIKSPTLALVEKSYLKQEAGGYCLDAEGLLPGSLKKTGERFKEVALNPLWVGKDGRGLYLPPQPGQIVIINFINYDSAFPFVAGIWGDKYKPAAAGTNEFILTDGKATFKIDQGFFSLANQTESLKGLLEKLIDEVAGLKTVGSPAAQTVSLDNQATLQALKLNIATLLKG